MPTPTKRQLEEIVRKHRMGQHRYELLVHSDETVLATRASRKIIEGWIPLGGMFQFKNKEEYGPKFYWGQTVWKPLDHPENKLTLLQRLNEYCHQKLDEWQGRS